MYAVFEDGSRQYKVSEGTVVKVDWREAEGERWAGQAIKVVTSQLRASIAPEVEAADLAVAYEPVWAIGTGKTPTSDEIAQMHEAVRAARRPCPRIESALRRHHRRHQRRVEMVGLRGVVDQGGIGNIMHRAGSRGVMGQAGDGGWDVDRRQVEDCCCE